MIDAMLKMIKIKIRNSLAYRAYIFFFDSIAWIRKRFESPSPHFVKQSCLIRNGFINASWVETGTYLGQTTELLSKNSKRVYSIEPSEALYLQAHRYFKNFSNVEILRGESEKILPKLLPQLSGDINFWLDGHYSEGITYKGAQTTPILDELECISENLHRFNNVCILIDDIRCFNPSLNEFSGYPSVNVLVNWSNRHNFFWKIEHDIFVMKNSR
jgi:hypothetical protein